MFEGVDLEQPATVTWWPEGTLPKPTENPKWGGIEREFPTLRDAINFVHRLTDSEKATAQVRFASEPGELGYRDLPPGL